VGEVAPNTRVASAPGRVNLLGEHVDHQGGTVLPIAIQMRTTVEYTPGSEWQIVSEEHEPGGPWTRHVEGVIELLTETGKAPTPGRLQIRSTIPERVGLASSAALQVAVAGALSDLPPWDLALLCQRVENEKVGVPCGLMDQATSACAIQENVMALDCGSGCFFHVPLPPCELYFFPSGIERSLMETPYAERLAEAEQPDSLAARHVAAERLRVEEGIALLDAGDLAGFGRLLYDSHASLRDDYRCSLPQLDDMVEGLAAVSGVLGARMMGAGWGGGVLVIAEAGEQLDGGIRLLSDDGLYRLE
jgi:galactokinase